MRPPRHGHEHIPTYIHEDDQAWDIARVEKEVEDARKAAKKAKQDPDEAEAQHPHRQYYSGATRYDLSLVADYIDESKRPTKWVLRYMSPQEVELCRIKITRDAKGDLNMKNAFSEALSYALRDIVNSPPIDGEEFDAAMLERVDGRITPAVLTKLSLSLGIDALYGAGIAAMTASQDLSRVEKKA